LGATAARPPASALPARDPRAPGPASSRGAAADAAAQE
jgi:hypothetical protein